MLTNPAPLMRSADPTVAAVEQLLDEEVAATSIYKTARRIGVARNTLKRIIRRKPVHLGTLALVKERLTVAKVAS